MKASGAKRLRSAAERAELKRLTALEAGRVLQHMALYEGNAGLVMPTAPVSEAGVAWAQGELEWLHVRPPGSSLSPSGSCALVCSAAMGSGGWDAAAEEREPQDSHWLMRIAEVYVALMDRRAAGSAPAAARLEERMRARLTGCPQPHLKALLAARDEGALHLQEAVLAWQAKRGDEAARVLGIGKSLAEKVLAAAPPASPRYDRTRDNLFRLLLVESQVVGARRQGVSLAEHALVQAEGLQPGDARTSYALGKVYHDSREHHDKARDTLREALHRAARPQFAALRSWILHLLANLERQHGNLSDAMNYLQEAQHDFARTANFEGEARVLDTRGNIALSMGRLSEARSLFLRSLDLKRQLKEMLGQTITLGNLARLALQEGGTARLEEAYDYFKHDLKLVKSMARERGAEDERGLVVASHGLGLVAILLQRWGAAARYLSTARKHAAQDGNAWGEMLADAALVQLALEKPLERAPLEKALVRLRDSATRSRRNAAQHVLLLFENLAEATDAQNRTKVGPSLERAYWALQGMGQETRYFQFYALAALKRLNSQGMPVSVEISREIAARAAEPLFGWMLREVQAP